MPGERPLETQGAASEDSRRACDGAQVVAASDLEDERRADREEEETVDRQVVEEPRLPPLPAHDAVEDGPVVQAKREKREVRTEREHDGGAEKRADGSPGESPAESRDRQADERQQRVRRKIPRVRHRQRPERNRENGEGGHEPA